MTTPKRSPLTLDLPDVVLEAIDAIQKARGVRFKTEVVKMAVMELYDRVRLLPSPPVKQEKAGGAR